MSCGWIEVFVIDLWRTLHEAAQYLTPFLWNRCREFWPGFRPLCGWEKARKILLATFAEEFIVDMCAGKHHLETFLLVRCHLFCSMQFLHH